MKFPLGISVERLDNVEPKQFYRNDTTIVHDKNKVTFLFADEDEAKDFYELMEKLRNRWVTLR